MIKPRKKLPHSYLVALGSEIRKLRLKRNLSLEVLGGEMGLDASNLQKIELGQNLTINTILKLCICLETTPAKYLKKIEWKLSEKDIDKLTNPRVIKKRKNNYSK